MDVLTTVASGKAEVASPFTGERGAFVHLELVEDDVPVGEVVLGDVVELSGDDGRAYSLVVRRATFTRVELRARGEGIELRNPPPEIVPLLARARGTGVLRVREHVVRVGDRLRLRAHVEAGQASARFVVRDDLVSARLDEAL